MTHVDPGARGEQEKPTPSELAAQDIADGLTDLLTWAHESGGDLRDQHVQQGRELLARGLAQALKLLSEVQ